MNASCPRNPEARCEDCLLNSLCLPKVLQPDEIALLDNIIERGRPLHKDQYVYSAGDTFTSIYAVRSGAIKVFSVSDSGIEQVTGFFLPGEIFGMDDIGYSRYCNSAIALETSSVCEIPFTKLEALSARIPSLQRHFFQLMSHEINADHQLISLLSKSNAEQRVAALLLSISQRNGRRKLSATRFRLPMSRADIGNYLGLTVETVSRILSRFQHQGVLKVNKKELEIVDMEALKLVVCS